MHSLNLYTKARAIIPPSGEGQFTGILKGVFDMDHERTFGENTAIFIRARANIGANAVLKQLYLSDWQDSRARDVVQPVNKANIIWEDHQYVTNSTTFASWQNHVNSAVRYFENGFGKPLFIGEYGFDPPTITHTTYSATWTTILSNEVAYLDSLQLAGRQWYAWDYLYGEYDVAERSSDFTAAESTWIIQTVLG